MFGNLFILYTGTFIRYVYFRFVKKKKVRFKELLNPVEDKDPKADEYNRFINEMTNRTYGCIFLILLVLLSLILVRYGII